MKQVSHQSEFVPTGKLLKQLGFSRTWLWKLIEKGEFKPGIHYYVLGARSRRWNVEMMRDWAINRSNPQAHQKRVEQFLEELEGTFPKPSTAKTPKATGKAA
jgi:predicted DNA-binding transcriptional regulator AlpA